MLRRSLFVVAALSIIAATAQAGAIKVHEWPVIITEYLVPQEVCCIDVIMDIGYWIHIINQDDCIELQQKDPFSYEGCIDLYILSNFYATLSCSIAPTGAVPGYYTCWIWPEDIEPGSDTVALCAKLSDANLSLVSAGAENVHVATITIKVVPQV